MKISQTKKDKGQFCCAYGCTNKPVNKLGGLCHTHYARKRREIDPVGVRYNQMKGKAKQRNIPFTIELGEFRLWCVLKGYIVIKGHRGKNATIDRRCNIHGYHLWNIQILTLSRNASKGNRFRGDEFDCPF